MRDSAHVLCSFSFVSTEVYFLLQPKVSSADSWTGREPAPRFLPSWCSSWVWFSASWPTRCPSLTPGRGRLSSSWSPPCRPVGRWSWLMPSRSWMSASSKWSRGRWRGPPFLPPCISSGPETSSGGVPSSVCCRRCPKVHNQAGTKLLLDKSLLPFQDPGSPGSVSASFSSQVELFMSTTSPWWMWIGWWKMWPIGHTAMCATPTISPSDSSSRLGDPNRSHAAQRGFCWKSSAARWSTPQTWTTGEPSALTYLSFDIYCCCLYLANIWTSLVSSFCIHIPHIYICLSDEMQNQFFCQTFPLNCIFFQP